MAAVSMHLATLWPTHALVPALGCGVMKDSAKFFVFFPAKISYAGGQGAEVWRLKVVTLSLPIHRDQHLSFADAS